MTEREILDTIETEEGRRWYLATWKDLVEGKIKPEDIVAELSVLKFGGCNVKEKDNVSE